MGENFMIIKTKKMSPREVKKKLHDFIDGISEDCGPEIEGMAEELKAHGDEFVDALSGVGAEYRDGGFYARYRDGGNGGVGTGTGDGASYRRGRRSWHRGGYGTSYREDENWQQQEEARKKAEQKLQEMERQLQEMRQQMTSGM